MSTRSGRLIHKPEDEEKEIKRTQSTRSRRQENNENINTDNVSSNKNKKRPNYVSYPTDDENCELIKTATVNDKPSRRRKKNLLVEVNTNQDVEPSADEINSKPAPRTTRRTRRFADETQNENQPKEEVPVKKNKKNKKKNKETTLNVLETKVTCKNTKISPKKSGRTKKVPGSDENEKSDDSMYHSAASRPCSPEPDVKHTQIQLDRKSLHILISPCSEIDRQLQIINKNAQEITEFVSDKLNSTFEIEQPEQAEPNHSNSLVKLTPEIKNKSRLTRQSSVLNSSNNKDIEINSTVHKSTLTPEVNNKRRLTRQSSVLNSTYEKDIEKISTPNKSTENINSTYDKIDNNSFKKNNKSYVTDNNITQISINDSKSFNIFNATPILVDSSLEESVIKSCNSSTLQPPPTPLQREGTFTKDGPEPIIILSKFDNGTPSSEILATPTKRAKSLQSPGCTPYPSNKKGRILNVTRSIERKSLTSAAPRLTKVAFCSPADNTNLANERKSKVIKSSIKGSHKSFVFEKNDSIDKPASRKRSYTANDVDEKSAKRKKTLEDRQEVFDRLSRPRSLSAQPRQTDHTPRKQTPAPPKSQPKSRSKLPNFAALHEKNFSKMESLDECVERKKKRAKRLLVPNGSITVLERSSPKPFTSEPKSTTESTPAHTEPLKIKSKPKESIKTTEKSFSTFTDVSKNIKSKNLEISTERKPGFTRFGFKLNLDVNPFSITNDTRKEKEIKPNGLKRELTAPSMSTSVKPRKEVVKNILNREKSTGNLRGKIDGERMEARTIIKGVRSNRRFELQMKMRKLN